MTKKLDFKEKTFPVKVRDIHKIGKTKSSGMSVFVYENKEKHPINVSKKCCVKKHVDLLLIEEKEKRHFVLIKNFNTLMYNHTLHHGKNIFTVIVCILLVQKKY